MIKLKMFHNAGEHAVRLRSSLFQVTSGGLAVYVSQGQEVWLETREHRGMTGRGNGFSIFSGFLLHPY